MMEPHRSRSKVSRRALMFAALSTAIGASTQADIVVSNLSDSGSNSLRAAIFAADADTSGNPVTIDITVTGALSLYDALPPITNDHGVTINGPGGSGVAPTFSINANGYRGLFIFATDVATQTVQGSVSVNNIAISGATATGGTGGLGDQGGGGGAGLGGAVFIGRGSVSLTNVQLSNNQAIGGNGGASSAGSGPGGGGGLGGSGGAGAGTGGITNAGGGGGVFGSLSGASAIGGFGGGGNSFNNGQPGALTGFVAAGGGDFATSSGGTGGIAGGGGGGGTMAGGGGGPVPAGDDQVAGGFGGGSGGVAVTNSGGKGGFGGGDGGQPDAGYGGFGGGGGGTVFLGSTSEGGFGAGNGAAGGSAQSGGGGGLGAGGAIFVRAGSSLSMTDVTMTGDSVSAGSGADGGQNGSAIGQGLFLGNTTTWSVSTDKTITIAESIGGGQNADANGGVTKSGAGTLALTAVNSYVGLTTINAGTLALGYSFDGTSGTLPATNSILVNSGGTLMLGNTAGEANVIGSGLNAPNVSIPAITLTGGSLTSFNGTTHNLGVLSMTGGTVAGTPDPSAGYNDFTLNSAIAVNATTTSSFITAPGGIGLRDNIPFNVSSGTGNLTISAALRDEPGITGGITKNQAGSMILTGSDTYTAGTVVNAGLLVFGSSTAFPSNTALTINGGKSAFTDLTVGATFVTQLNSLSIAGSAGHWSGLLDLSNTDLVIHNAQLATITDQIAQGSNNGTWTGTAGITSSAAAGDTNHLTALGVILNGSTYGTATGSLGTFDGLNPAAGDVLIKYTYFGDTNLDGKVDGSDYSRIDNGAINHLTGWFNGDFNYDGIINGSDYTLIDNAFNTQGSQLTAAVSTPNALATSQVAGTSSVPEPATFCLVTGLMLALLGRRNISVNESARLRTGA